VNRVLALGFGETSWDRLRDRALADDLPFLRGAAEGGACGITVSPQPLATALLWATVVTGRTPAGHGIFGPVRRDGNGPPRPVSFRDLAAPPIWRLLEDAGVPAGIFNVVYADASDTASGFTVVRGPGPRIDRSLVHPEDLYPDLRRRFGHWMMTTTVPARPDWVSIETREIETRTEVLVHLLRTRPWRFALAHLPEIAVAQHRLWDAGPGALRALHAVVDRTMARLAEAAGPDTTVFVFSECGAGPLRHGVCLNAWLAREGYLHRRGGAAPRVGRSLARARDRTYRFMPWAFGLSRLARRARAAISASLIDWSRTRAFCPGETAEIMLTVPAPERSALAGDLRARLLALRDPEGRRVVEDVIPREAWDSSWDFTPDLTVVWDADAYLPMATFDDSDEVFADSPPRPSGWPLTGAHRREGMVLASGPGIAPTDLGRVRTVDLVPTWLDLLGVPVPKEIEGTSFAPALFGRP